MSQLEFDALHCGSSALAARSAEALPSDTVASDVDNERGSEALDSEHSDDSELLRKQEQQTMLLQMNALKQQTVVVTR